MLTAICSAAHSSPKQHFERKKLCLSASWKLRVLWWNVLCYTSGWEVCSWHNNFSTIITVIPGFHYKFVTTGKRIKNTTWRIK